MGYLMPNFFYFVYMICIQIIGYIVVYSQHNYTCTLTNIHLHAETSLTGNDDFNNERIHFL